MSYIVRTGNLAQKPELRQGTKAAYCYARVITTDRLRNDTGDYYDGPITAYNLTVFGQQAEHLVATAQESGNVRVLFAGTLTVSEYTTKDGSTAHSNDVRVDELGISLRHQNVTVTPLKG